MGLFLFWLGLAWALIGVINLVSVDWAKGGQLFYFLLFLLTQPLRLVCLTELRLSSLARNMYRALSIFCCVAAKESHDENLL
jgi:hypothetical protein